MLIVDTGFLLALLNQKDQHHSAALNHQHSHTQGWITTWPVLTEALYLIANRIHLDCAIGVLDDVQSGVLKVWNIPQEQTNHIKKLMRKYKSLPMDLADASLVLLAEHLGSGKILSTDARDFGAYRWKNRHPFENVLLKA